MSALPAHMSVLLSDVRADRSFLDFALVQRPTPTIAKPTDVIIEMHAAPINPSDIGATAAAAAVRSCHCRCCLLLLLQV
jgi:hypothetical protein